MVLRVSTPIRARELAHANSVDWSAAIDAADANPRCSDDSRNRRPYDWRTCTYNAALWHADTGAVDNGGMRIGCHRGCTEYEEKDAR